MNGNDRPVIARHSDQRGTLPKPLALRKASEKYPENVHEENPAGLLVPVASAYSRNPILDATAISGTRGLKEFTTKYSTFEYTVIGQYRKT